MIDHGCKRKLLICCHLPGVCLFDYTIGNRAMASLHNTPQSEIIGCGGCHMSLAIFNSFFECGSWNPIEPGCLYLTALMVATGQQELWVWVWHNTTSYPFHVATSKCPSLEQENE
uniref:Uncharacterized protein n=1 Tax=Nelumbo nucifera TaxID=4432 RepID=A0A822ZQM9_NELNU|nr:TPA_asm: hypothetical protein HUJ06_003466 [Nelumbo nucifera]